VAALHYGKVMDDAERDRINAELQADLAIEPPSQGQIQFE
jgi:hypothetical protein